MKFPGLISYVSAGIVVTAVAVAPRASRYLNASPTPDSEVEMAETSMVAEPPARQSPPDRLKVSVKQREVTPPTEALVAEDRPDTHKSCERQEPPRKQIARLEPVAPPSPVAPTPKEMDLSERLPEDAKRTFLSLVSEGSRLQEGEETTPAYTAMIPVTMADRLIESGVFRAGVTHGDRRLFVFAEGGLSNVRSPQLAGRVDAKGFSGRMIVLSRSVHAALVSQVARKFGIPSIELTPCLLVQSQLDRAVLATQHRAARKQGLALGDISYTVGQFEYAAGIPFTYVINEIHAKDGKRIAVGETQKGSSTVAGSSAVEHGSRLASNNNGSPVAQ